MPDGQRLKKLKIFASLVYMHFHFHCNNAFESLFYDTQPTPQVMIRPTYKVNLIFLFRIDNC